MGIIYDLAKAAKSSNRTAFFDLSASELEQLRSRMQNGRRKTQIDPESINRGKKSA